MRMALILSAFRLIHDYLSNWQQRTKLMFIVHGKMLNSDCLKSQWLDLYYSILSDLFLIIDETEFASYADDNTLYDAGNTIEDVTLSFQESSKNFSNGFLIMKGNAGKTSWYKNWF